MAVATYLYISTSGNGAGFEWGAPTPDEVRVYVVSDGGAVSLLGSGTYWANGYYTLPGAAYGYAPPEFARDDPYWDSFDPSQTWYSWSGTAQEYWDIRYGIRDASGATYSSLIKLKPPGDAARDFTTTNAYGSDLEQGGGVYYDTSAIPGAQWNAGDMYLIVTPWYPSGEEPAVTVVKGAVNLTSLFASEHQTYHTADFWVPGVVEKPKFWRDLAGTTETV